MGGGEDTGDLAMLELFRAELDSHLPVLSEGLLALEKNSDQPKWFEAMMRAAHSIKGAARIVGVEGAVRVAHVLEDCFVAAQQRDICLGPGAVDVLLRGVDVLGAFHGPVRRRLRTRPSVKSSTRLRPCASRRSPNSHRQRPPFCWNYRTWSRPTARTCASNSLSTDSAGPRLTASTLNTFARSNRPL